MNRFFLLTVAAFLFFGLTAAAQTNPHLEKLAKDPKTAEMAAKADVYVLGHPLVHNSKETPVQKSKVEQSTIKRKQHKKYKRSSA